MTYFVLFFLGEGVAWSCFGGTTGQLDAPGSQRDPTRLMQQRNQLRLYGGRVSSHATCHLYGERAPGGDAL